jgi:hypothetical protein
MLVLLTGYHHLKGDIYILTLIDHNTCSRYKRKLNGLTSTVVLLICSSTKVGQQIITGCGANVIRGPLLSNLFYSEIIKYKGAWSPVLWHLHQCQEDWSVLSIHRVDRWKEWCINWMILYDYLSLQNKPGTRKWRVISPQWMLGRKHRITLIRSLTSSFVHATHSAGQFKHIINNIN